MCSAKQKKEKMQNKQTEKRVQEKKVDLVAWKFRTVSEGLKGSTVAVCRCSPFHMTWLELFLMPDHWPEIVFFSFSNFSVIGKSSLACWKPVTAMAAKPSPSWTSKALCKTLSACCVVRSWMFRDRTAALNRTSIRNMTFLCKRSERATKLSCEYWEKPQSEILTTFIIHACWFYFLTYGLHRRQWIRHFIAFCVLFYAFDTSCGSNGFGA